MAITPPAVRTTWLRLALRLALWALLALILTGIAALVASSCAARSREVADAREAAPAGGRFVPAGDVQIFVQEVGSPEAPAVLLVHGTGAWSETWRESMNALAAGGFRAIAIDLPPFGYSERPPDGTYGKRAQGDRIVRIIEALGIERAILVGHSFGGGPTVEAALSAPEHVRGIVLVDAALGIREPGAHAEPLPLPLRAFFASGPVRDGVVAGLLTNPSMTRRLIEGFVFDPASVTDERIAVYQRPLGVRGTTAATARWLPSLLAADADAPSEGPASYATLGGPVVAIWGTEDSITPIAQGERLVALTPGAELLRLAGVGHIPQIEDPTGFNRLLVEVVTRLRDP